MTAESPKAPESKARMAWFLDNRHQAFLADRYDPVEASAPVGSETPPHRHTRHRNAEEKTGDLRRSDPRRSAPAGRTLIETPGSGGGR